MGKVNWTFEKVFGEVAKTGCKLITKEYKNNKQILDIECSCGEIFPVRWGDFLKGQNKCKHCTGNNLRYSDVKKYIESKGCILKSKKYKNYSGKLDIICKCGNPMHISFDAFKKGSGMCHDCFKKENPFHLKFKIEDIKSYIEENSNAKLMSKEYVDCFSHLIIMCECGEEYPCSFAHIKQQDKIQCPKCASIETSNKNRLSFEEIEKRIKDVYGDEYDLVSIDNYQNFKKGTITVKHNICGNSYPTLLHTMIVKNRRCKVCEKSESLGVKKLSNWLDSQGIEYVREYTFEDCRHLRKLPFDVYIPSLNLCIEYDGQQHFKPVERFGGEEGFKLTKLRDGIKNNYCKDNNINLLRIKYTNYKRLEKVLLNFFEKYVNTELTKEGKIFLEV